MKNPNFFIIGAPKCGTTALAAYLGAHESVFISPMKEPFFWSSDIPPPWGDQVLDFPRNLNEYLRLFGDAGEDHLAVGEGSTTYIWSEVAVDRILAFAPEAKFIAMVRNPIQLARTLHSTEVYFFNEPEKDFETAWRLGHERAKSPDQGIRTRLNYRRIASLGTQLDRFISRVPSPQRHIILFDEFAANTKACYEEVLRFLGVPSDGRIEFPVINAAGTHRFDSVAHFVMQPPRWVGSLVRVFRPLFRRLGLRHLRGRVLSVLTRPIRKVPLKSDFHAELANAFRDEILLMSRLLGKDFSHWLDPK